MVSHVLSDHGHQPIIIDSMATGSPKLVKQFHSYVGDIAHKNQIKAIINQHSDIQRVVHCAGKILVPESVMHPDQYYYENVSKSLELFTNLNSFGINKILFSSSASIYEANNGEIVNENSPLKPLSPYAKNMLVLEMIFEDFCKAFDMKAVALRFFNRIGADPKMRCGPGLTNTSHLLGNLVRVAEGITNDIKITGFNWPTKDGTGVRDYIHVLDAARASVEILDNQFKNKSILLTGSPSIKVKDVMVMIKSILGDKISLEFKDEEIKGHYGLTPYSFRPKIAEKYISNVQIDLGQGLLDTIFEVYKEADEAGEKIAFDFDIQDNSN